MAGWLLKLRFKIVGFTQRNADYHPVVCFFFRFFSWLEATTMLGGEVLYMLEKSSVLCYDRANRTGGRMAMRNFALMVLSLYACIFVATQTIHIMERRSLHRCDFSRLMQHNTVVNRGIVFLMENNKYIRRKRKKERYFYYYIKKAYKYIMLLSIPWLLVVYFMEWYLIRNVLLSWWIFSFVIAMVPILTLVLISIIYDVEIWRNNRKRKKNN